MNVLKTPVAATANLGVWAFVFFIGLIVIHHSLVFLGFYGMDDINYARYAVQVASGQPLHLKTTDFFELRWGAIYGTAFFYWISGVNKFSNAAFSLCTVVLTGYLLYRMVSKLPLKYIFAALLLFFLDYHILFSSHRIWADTSVMLFTLGAYYFYWRAADKGWWHSAAFSLCLLLVMISKETIVLLIPLLLYLFIRDIVKKRKLHFWKGAALFSCILFGAYLLLFKIYTGDWIYRYHVILNGSYENGCSFDMMPFAETLRRIGYYLWEAFLLNGDMILIVFGVCGFIYRRKVMPGNLERQVAVAFFILLMSSNFMTFSLEHYLPLCQDARHFLFLFPFAAFTGAFMLNAYIDNPRTYWLLPLLMIIATCVIFLTGGGEIKYIYLLVSGILLLPLCFRMFSRTLLFAALTATLLIRPAYDILDDKFDFYNDHQNLINADFSRKYPNAVVYTVDALTAELSEFFMEFKPGSVSFRFPISKDSSGSNVYFLINKDWNPEMAIEVEHLSKDPGLISVSERKGVMTLYHVQSEVALDSLVNAQMRHGVVQ